jgi:hypothetical protein
MRLHISKETARRTFIVVFGTDNVNTMAVEQRYFAVRHLPRLPALRKVNDDGTTFPQGMRGVRTPDLSR